MLLPTEQKARRDLLHTALRRLLSGEVLSRRELFSSTSAQSAKTTWQRQIMQLLTKAAVVTRQGSTKSAIYSAKNTDEIQRILADPNVMDEMLRESSRHVRESVDDDSPSCPDPTDTELPVPPIGSSGAEELLTQTLKLSYMTAEAIGDIRERMVRIEKTVEDILSFLTAPTTDATDAATGEPK